MAWYQPPDMPALAPVQVRIVSVGLRRVFVTTLLDVATAVPEDVVIAADPAGLHFNKSAFDPFDAP